jgi:hypothetical protein
MTLATNGNVGIGSTAPQTKLEVVTATNNYGLSHTDGTTRISSFVGPGQAGTPGSWFGTQSNHPLRFYTNGQLNMTIDTNGNVIQNRDKGGLVKAMAYVDADGKILRCYNGQTGASLTGGTTNTGCGFTVTQFTAGGYGVDFGFQVDDRFVSVSPQYCSDCFSGHAKNVGANWTTAPSATTINVFTFETDEPNDAHSYSFMIIVY